MLFTICTVAFLLAVVVFGWSHRNRYAHLQPNLAGRIRYQIVTLPRARFLDQRLQREVKIFNRLGVVLPTVHGVAVAYTTYQRMLLKQPNAQPQASPADRLLYAYACAVLLTKIQDELRQKQLRRNLRLLLAPRQKICRRGDWVWVPWGGDFSRLPACKALPGGCLYPEQPGFVVAETYQTVVFPSYLCHRNANFTIKQFVDFYELSAAAWQKITFVVAPDKAAYTCDLTRGVVTCCHSATGATQTWRFHGDNLRLGTSVCAKTDALEIYLCWQGTVTVSRNGGQKLLLTGAQQAFYQRVQTIMIQAGTAKYIRGEKLRARYQAARQYVPSLAGLTKVVVLTRPETFFSVLDDLGYYQKAAELGQGFNLVFLYNGTNQLVADFVTGYLAPPTIAECQTKGLLLFFLDRTVITPDALYFFTKLTKTPVYPQLPPPEYTEHRPKCAPARYEFMVTNVQGKSCTRTVQIPLRFRTPQVVSVQGDRLTAVGLASGRVSVYQLPAPLAWEGEWLTTRVVIPVKLVLAAYEKKIITIVHREQVAKRRLRKAEFLASISDIVVQTAVPALNKIFAKPVATTADAGLLSVVKAAHQNLDQKLFLVALGDRHELPSDVWQYLVDQVLGLRWLGGKVHLVPCVNLLGNFTLACTVAGEKHLFATKKDLSNSTKKNTIKYG